jgi:parvulin-like peptidyl-prolyl isomerase
MRKKMTLMVALVALMVAMFAPAAFASHIDVDVVGDENVVRTEGDDVRFNAVCQNIIGSVGDIEQTQYGNAEATAEDDSEATAEVAQEQDVTIAQGNSCLNDHH